MHKKSSILLIIIVIVAVILAGVFMFNRVISARCGDGVCGSYEKSRGNCDLDCKNTFINNSKNITNPAKQEITYVALGASETVGSSATPYPTAGFSYLIRDRLKNYYKNVNYFNFAEGGKPASYVYSAEVPKSLSKNPDFVTLMTGGNDIITGVSEEEFSKNLDLILKTLNDNGIKVFIGTFPDLSNLPRFKQAPDSRVTKDRVIAFNEIIKNKAKKYNAIFVDVYDSNLSTDNSLIALKTPQGAKDGLHPNTEGHILLADLFLEKINKIF